MEKDVPGEKKVGIEGLSYKQRKSFLHFLDLAELDIDEEVEHGITDEDEAEVEREHIVRLRDKLLNRTLSQPEQKK